MAMVDVTDPDNYPKYIAANKAAFDKYGAKFLVRGGQGQVFEGACGNAPGRHRVRQLPDRARLLPFAGISGGAEAAQPIRHGHFAIVEAPDDPFPRHRPEGRPVRAPEARRHGQATVYNEDPARRRKPSRTRVSNGCTSST
jgi:uncharacterized protein (DUF1330 family)